MEHRIIKVTEFSEHTTITDLEMKFNVSGEVEDCIIVKRNGQDIAFVRFVDEEGVDSAQVFNGTEFMNAILQIDVASVDEYLAAKESLQKPEENKAHDNPMYDILTSEANENTTIQNLVEAKPENQKIETQLIERQEDLSETVFIQHKEETYPNLQGEKEQLELQKKQVSQKLEEAQKSVELNRNSSDRVPVSSKDPFQQLMSLNYLMVTGVLYFTLNFIVLIVG